MEPIILNSSKSNQIKNALINEKLTEDSVTEERVITWLDAKKVCFLNRTKVNLNEEWVYVGNAEIEEFKSAAEEEFKDEEEL